MKTNIEIPDWLTEDLVIRIKSLYEPRYQRPLTEQEVISIALSLSSIVFIYLKVKRRKEYGI